MAGVTLRGQWPEHQHEIIALRPHQRETALEFFRPHLFEAVAEQLGNGVTVAVFEILEVVFFGVFAEKVRQAVTEQRRLIEQPRLVVGRGDRLVGGE